MWWTGCALRTGHGAGYDLPGELGRKLRFGQLSEAEAKALLSVPRATFDGQYCAIIAAMQQRLGTALILPHAWLCDALQCRFADRGGGYFADSNHLGRYGVAKVAPAFTVIGVPQ